MSHTTESKILMSLLIMKQVQILYNYCERIEAEVVKILYN